MYDYLIKNADCVFYNKKSSKVEKATIAIKNGYIAAINPNPTAEAHKSIDATGLTLFPGLIDTQVHFREPGLEHKETIEKGSLSALMGGLTGYFEMPNTTPPTLFEEDLNNKLSIAKNTSWTNYAFYIGASENNVNQLSELEKLPGCSGVKMFMGSSTGNLLVEQDELLEDVVKNGVRRMAVHCEDEARLKQRKSIVATENSNVSLHPIWRDELTAYIATEKIVNLAKKYKRPLHVLHVTTAEEMSFLNKEKDTLISVECTPQHLLFSAPECYEKLGTKAQMNPPIRDGKHQAALWKAINNKTVDIIGSDHAPHTLEEKAKSYPNSPSGMTGVQTTLTLLLNQVNKGKISLFDIVRLMSYNPSQLFKIKEQGEIKPDNNASFSIVDLKKENVITNDWIKSQCGWTPFDGTKVKGWPRMVFINGVLSMKDDKVIEKAPVKPYLFSLE